ncbi:MAG: hypothetical protein GF344_19260, partial [Chitinivibrionales bacterium]|nr:hypothetical protein [Chitinivibrionales bacterium]MBD3358762.1 hypothetical protein [Chitinivibrionales bacterium]
MTHQENRLENTMNYAELKMRVMDVKGVGTEERADELIRAIAGHVVSRVDETLAHDITGRLPEPLTFESLREHDTGLGSATTDQFFDTIRHHFDLRKDRARQV